MTIHQQIDHHGQGWGLPLAVGLRVGSRDDRLAEGQGRCRVAAVSEAILFGFVVFCGSCKTRPLRFANLRSGPFSFNRVAGSSPRCARSRGHAPRRRQLTTNSLGGRAAATNLSASLRRAEALAKRHDCQVSYASPHSFERLSCVSVAVDATDSERRFSSVQEVVAIGASHE